MILKKEDSDFIKNAFHKMESKEDLLMLLNHIKPIIYGNKSESFELKHLNYNANQNLISRYKSFTIKKKSGDERTILSPSPGLKALQKCLNLIFQNIYDVNTAVTGFVNGKSIIDNAVIHAGSNYIYNIDLKDFFSSIDQARIWGRLQKPPFLLNDQTDRIEIANIICALCCHKISVERLDSKQEWQIVTKNVLPQGAPTSPTIANIICQQLDFYLSAVAKRFGLKYSRYADDITFSSMHNVYNKNGKFVKELHRIILSQNFHIKKSKTRLQKKGFKQEVTGLIVNNKVNVKKRYIKQLRLWLFYWETYGVERASKFITYQYMKEKGHVKKKCPDIPSLIKGKLDFLKMVKGAENETYSLLHKRYNSLIFKNNFTFDIIDTGVLEESNTRPIETVTFLKYFKYDNTYSFKDLVHKPINEDDFNYLEILKKSTKQFSEIVVGKNNRINMPKKVVGETQIFLKKLSTIGLVYFEKTANHPLEDSKTGAIIQEFKRNYRFGNEKSESSILYELIKNTAKKRVFTNQSEGVSFSFGSKNNSSQFDIDQLNFIPDINKFQSKANFFTWVPNITIALAVMFDSILKHSNIDGHRGFAFADKKISFEIQRKLVNDLIEIELIVTDLRSIFVGDLDNVFLDMRRDFLPTLKGICDFKVQFKTMNNINYECKILPYSETLIVLKHEIEGFKYIFKFYD